jgi:hypothetical protein
MVYGAAHDSALAFLLLTAAYMHAFVVTFIARVVVENVKHVMNACLR